MVIAHVSHILAGPGAILFGLATHLLAWRGTVSAGLLLRALWNTVRIRISSPHLERANLWCKGREGKNERSVGTMKKVEFGVVHVIFTIV